MEGKPKASSNEYKRAFMERTYDHVHVIVPRGSKAKLKEAAADEGLTVNRYINAAINEKLAADGRGTLEEERKG